MEMITNKQISSKLTDALRNCGMTQAELARRLGVRQQQISCYLLGKKMPSLDTFANLCKILGLDANDVLCISD